MDLKRGLLSSDLTSDFTSALLPLLKESYKDAYLGRTLLSKYANPDPQALRQRENAALAKWLDVEQRNVKTNIRLMVDDHEEMSIGGLNLESVLRVAASIVRKVIGKTVPMEVLLGSFSGGASTSLRRQPGMVARKYTEQPDVTQEAWDLIWPWIYRDHDLWLEMNPKVLNPRFVEGNVMFFVPKNDEIERTAAKEPDLNMFLQKAAGDFIRKRLKKVGIDLNDQRVNREWACIGSMTRDIATLDLSSASDTVTTQLVCRLLSVDWFSFLERARCRKTQLPDGTWHENEMLSSMGNGFTFELESLVFYSLIKAVDTLTRTRGVVSVYGDDIIVSTRIAPLVMRLFAYLGFKVNRSKSFVRGAFRESCGGHYHDGVDVTPFYIKRPINTLPELIRVLNSLRRWANDSGWCRDDMWDLWRAFARHVPVKLHGGYDLASKESLASLSGPGYLLREMTKTSRSSTYDAGLYLGWQNEAISRTEPTESKTSVVIRLGTYVVVKPRRWYASTFGLSAPAFPREYSCALGG